MNTFTKTQNKFKMKFTESDEEWNAFLYGTIIGIFAGIAIGFIIVLCCLI